MPQSKNSVYNSNSPINILLADDDEDDRHFFAKVLKSIPINTQFKSVVDGEKLMHYLLGNLNRLPDVLFLDFNMPRKNGMECLSEINQHEKLRQLPVIIYSTYIQKELAGLLYDKGAYYYARKGDLSELKIFIHRVLNMMVEKTFKRPAKDNFILGLVEA